jgi:hypothetical protein
MKTATLILLGTSTAFAVTSVYLTHRVREGRTVVLQTQAERSQLATRVKQLEQEQQLLASEVETLRATDGPAIAPAPARVVSNSQAAPQATRATVENRPPVFTTFRAGPPQSPIMQKMMRTRMRQSLARTYEDVGEAVGLSGEQSGKLLDLLAEQATPWTVEPWPADAEGQAAMRRKMQEKAQKQQADLAALIGPERMPQFAEYQKTLPARHDLLNLQEQFAAAEVPLNEEQRRQLLDKLIDDQKRNDRPTFIPGPSPEETRAQVLAWENERDARMLENVQGVLTPEQLAVLRDHQEYEREMRKHMQLAMPMNSSDAVSGTSMSAVAILQPPPQQ